MGEWRGANAGESTGGDDERLDDASRLAALWRSGCRCVLITTVEEAEALEVVRSAAHADSREPLAWTRTEGLHDPRLGPAPSSGVRRGSADGFDALQTMAPEVALAGLGGVASGGGRTALVALDLLGHLGEPLCARGLRDLLGRLEGGDARLVLIDAGGEAPHWLTAHAERFELSLPDDEELETIARGALREADRRRPLEIRIQKSTWSAMLRALSGLSRRQARRLVTEAAVSDGALTDEDLERVLEAKRLLISRDGPLDFVKAPTSLDELGGLSGLKRWLAARAGSFDAEASAWGLTPPRGVLLLGVQGAGKSLCAKAIATAWKRPLLRLDAGALYDRFVGESERRLRDALRQAERMAPMVLWIDEIEKAFAGAGAQSTDGGLSKRMFGALLTWMQEHRAPVFLVATANDISALPPELMRKGRFDEIFFVDLPGEAAREAIARIHLEKRGQKAEGFDLGAIVAASAGYSGAEIEQGIVSALHGAFADRRALTTADVVSALEASPPLSVTMRERIADLRAWAEGRCVPAG